MPNRAVHDVVGTGAGALVAVLMAGDQPSDQVFLETVGGCLAGLFASRLPDQIDPPIFPDHRDVGHALFIAGGAVASLWKEARKVQDALRSYADSLATKRETSPDMSDFEKFANRTLEILCRIAAGMIAGAIGGYASHLTLDACSPRGLPLICKAF